MTVLAKACKGHEFLYISRSAHKVNKQKAKQIAETLNSLQYNIAPDEVWHIFEIDEYDRAFDYASNQSFTLYNGILKEKKARGME